jgi:tripartite-type tricarboxylate transporter receptor subunit TctC
VIALAKIAILLLEDARWIFAAPCMRGRLISQGATLPLGPPEAFAAYVAADSERWGQVIRSADIKAD